MSEPATQSPSPTTGTVTSDDGIVIGYYKSGQGPGVILVHGAAQSAQSFSTLARGLSEDFTVFVPDRRGRGLSKHYGEFHGLRTEVADLSALLDATGCNYVFGLSSGAVIAIETALKRPDITKLALYEPPLSFNGVVHGEWAEEYERGMQAGKLGSALVAALKGTADRTAIRFVPRFLIAAPLNFVITRTAKRPTPESETISPVDLIPTVHYDIRTVRDAAGSLERFAELVCDVLLLGGSKSHRNLGASLDGLSKVLPRAKRVRLPGVGHTAADNSKQPSLVSAELLSFFGSSPERKEDDERRAHGPVADVPTMVGFEWTPRTIDPQMRSLPGDLWCVRDAFSALMQWPPGSEEWHRFVEAPDGPADMERLIDHLGLVSYDPEHTEHVERLRQALDHPGVACYKFHRMRMEHCMYQPHLRHLQPLPPQYLLADPDPEMFQIIVDSRQPTHACTRCQQA